MSNTKIVIEERAADIGNFMVGRLLPFRRKRAVGPFVFIDHMGPAALDVAQNLEVGPHPHIGLSTLTFLFEGSIRHRDSIGSDCEIKPGAVNWMTAGKGVVHSERTPDDLRGKTKKLHGMQIWVGLPKELEDCEPHFTHVAASDIPAWREGDLDLKLIAGEALGKKSPVPVHSELYFIEIKCAKPQTVSLAGRLFGESALYILEGEVYVEGQTFGPKQLLVAVDSGMCEFKTGKNTTVYMFGGEPFPEERYIDWNFVHSDQAVLKQAVKDWKERKFPNVPGDDGYVPYPGTK